MRVAAHRTTAARPSYPQSYRNSNFHERSKGPYWVTLLFDADIPASAHPLLASIRPSVGLSRRRRPRSLSRFAAYTSPRAPWNSCVVYDDDAVFPVPVVWSSCRISRRPRKPPKIGSQQHFVQQPVSHPQESVATALLRVLADTDIGFGCIWAKRAQQVRVVTAALQMA